MLRLRKQSALLFAALFALTVLLERKGLIKRVRNRQDRRTINIFPTPKGRNLKNELLAHAIRINETATAGLTEEKIAIVRNVLAHMKGNLDREDDNGAA